MSQRAFSKMIGVDCGNYSKYEMGKLLPGDDLIDKLEEFCPLNDIEIELIRALRSCDRMLRLSIQEDES